uniref:Uncharacterized protein n=1 Tax=Amphimedon queenslandica TaxID=400682 RepID=A0A1X7TWH0_AMPQE
MYRLLSEEEREDSYWETIEDVANKLFLIRCLPEGLLSLEVTLPGFSSPTIIMPPRGDLHLDVRLNYPFLCLFVDNVLEYQLYNMVCGQIKGAASATTSNNRMVGKCSTVWNI